MRLAACIAAALLAATPGTLARAASPRECSAVPRPSAEDARPWAKSGPYAAGLKAFLAGRDAASVVPLRSAWGLIREDLARAFAQTACNEATIRTTLGQRVFASPPQAVPAEDRFLPPRPIALAVASGLCAAGDPDAAAAWLVESTKPDDVAARAAAAVLWVAAGKVDSARALIPPHATGAGWEPARRALEERSRPDGKEAPP